MRKYIALFIFLIFLGVMFTNSALATSHGFEPVGENNNFFVPNPDVGSGPAGQKTFGDTVTQIISIALLAIGSLAVIFLIIGGFMYVTSFGREEQVETAKKIIQFSILGLVITFLSFVIVRIISGILISGKTGLGI